MKLNDIAWNFSNKYYIDPKEFNKDVFEYQERVFDGDNNWDPEEIVFDIPELQIEYMSWFSGPDDLLRNEFLTEEYQNIFEEEEPDENGYPTYQAEIIAILKARNGKYFTALEFLLQVHNQQANKDLNDYSFFEGIDLKNPKTINGLPTYYVSAGCYDPEDDDEEM